MSLFKKILVVSFCVLAISTSGEAKENTVTMKNLDDLNHEAILLEKELEILKKKVAIKKMENELEAAANGGKEAPPLTATSPFMGQALLPEPAIVLPEKKPEKPEPPAPSPPVKKKINPHKFSSEEISSMPKVKSIYGFGGKRKAALRFSDGSTANVHEDGDFRIGSKKYMVSEIQSTGVFVKKTHKGESLTLRFAATQKEDSSSKPSGNQADFMSPMTFPPAPQFLDSTSNKYED